MVLIGIFAFGYADSGDILISFPSPGPAPQDLAWDGEYLWVIDDSTDSIYKLDPQNGGVVASLRAPGPQPRGLTWDGSHLWVSDDALRKIYRIDPEQGKTVKEIEAPVIPVKKGYSPLGGLAWDGKHLWSGFIAGWSSRMNMIDTASGLVVESRSGYGIPTLLASDGKFLWGACDNGGLRSGIIYQYNLQDGTLINQYNTIGDYPAGLASDGRNLWFVDKESGLIYCMAID